MAEPKRRMVIFLEGGLIQEIYTDFDMDVFILDGDVEGTPEEELAIIKDLDGDSVANDRCLAHWEVPADPKNTEYFVKQALAEEARLKTEEHERSEVIE